ncbi:MAG: hypothetical protein IJ007_07815 [Oscillospiraceae bacterium]|nr:hypothetical protein [Oscillospiraceae bacterium]
MIKFLERLRALLFFLIVLAAMSMCAVRLMKIQVVDGEMYLEMAESTSIVKQDIYAPRGEIVDADGKEVVSNKVGYNVILEKAFLPSDKQEMNRIIIEIAHILEEDGVEWIDTLPITDKKPYEFLEARESDIAKLRKNISVQPYATAENCIDEMIKQYEIDESYSQDEKRIIAGIRYEMVLHSFSLSNRYTLAEDIPMDTVVKLKEASYRLEGMDIVEEGLRVYSSGSAAPHIIGTVGSINAEEYALLKENGYRLNDTLGKSGIEKAMEDQLRGTTGERSLELLHGVVVSDTVTEEAVPGNTVQLTLDMDYQKKVQEILENHIYWLQHQTDERNAKGTGGNAGAIVICNAKTGAVLAMATAPTYDINDYLENYSLVANGENSPLMNRATSGLYRPGSTFKTVTATAALNYGIVGVHDTITCNKIYNYWDDYKPECTGWHSRINVVTAIEKSCNIFFYETGRLMNIDKLSDYAELFGFGQSTGIETGDTAGYFANPDSFTKRRLEWQAGLVVQAAIGQSETYATPLQLCMQACAIANKGNRYKPYVVDSVHTYNMESLVYETQPEVVQVIPDETGVTFDTVIKGMEQAANFVEYSYPDVEDYYTDYLLTNLPKQAAIKTGTPQMTSKEDTGSAFIGFYPSDDPEIAFSGFIEHGEYSKLMIKQLVEAYYNDSYKVPSPVQTPVENIPDILAGLTDTDTVNTTAISIQ